MLTVEETLEWFPGADRRGLRAGALWCDAAVPDSQRLILEMLHWAAAYGARAINYAVARRLVVEGGSVVGVATPDLATGTDCEFRAPVVVNGAGPWCRQVARAFDRDVPELFLPSLGFNVLLDVGQCGILGSVGEYGWGGAASTNFWIDPQESLIGLSMAQYMPSGYHLIGPDFRVAAYQAIVD